MDIPTATVAHAGMPVFFFDIHDDGAVLHDFHGGDFESLKDAIERAEEVVENVRRHDPASGADRPFAIEVHDQAGEVVYVARLHST